jgi:hypothetical protein
MKEHSLNDQVYLAAYTEDAQRAAAKPLAKISRDETLRYHAADHTLGQVYPEAKKLAGAEGFTADELLLIEVVALFHDTGFQKEYVANEPIGAAAAKAYAEKSGNDFLIKNAQLIYEAVLNTNMKERPKNKFEAVIRDADLAILGKPEFLIWNRRLRQETLLHPDPTSDTYQAALTQKAWLIDQLAFLDNHHWWTDAAKAAYTIQKALSRQALIDLIALEKD